MLGCSLEVEVVVAVVVEMGVAVSAAFYMSWELLWSLACEWQNVTHPIKGPQPTYLYKPLDYSVIDKMDCSCKMKMENLFKLKNF